jgi:hypothetical protein
MGVFGDAGWEKQELELLQQILNEIKKQTLANSEASKSIEATLTDISKKLDQLLTPEVESFTIQQTGDNMPLTAPDPGATLQFTATPTPAGSALPAGVVPTWTSSDTTNVTITTDPTGLIATVVLSSAIPVGESVTLTISATLPDGTTPTGSASFTVGAAPSVEVTGFTIVQTA